MNKIDKLSQLKELLDSNSISKEEFDKLKNDLLTTENESSDNNRGMSFQENFGKNNETHLTAPDVGNLYDLTKEEIKAVRDFLCKKMDMGAINDQYSDDENKFMDIHVITKPMSKTMGKVFKIGIVLILALIIIPPLVFGGDEENSSIKTSFNNCSELAHYVNNKRYSVLEAQWGSGNVGKPWDASAVGELKMKVNVSWSNIKCNGKPVNLTFENGHLGISDAFDKLPRGTSAPNCSDYE